MTPVDRQLSELSVFVSQKFAAGAVTSQPVAGGARLIEITNVKLPPGWNQALVTVIFLAPAGYPGAKPDCFWVTPTPLMLANGGMPKASNAGNPIPSAPPRVATWFSWHLQGWSPNRDTLVTYFVAVLQRLGLPE